MNLDHWLNAILMPITVSDLLNIIKYNFYALDGSPRKVWRQGANIEIRRARALHAAAEGALGDKILNIRKRPRAIEIDQHKGRLTVKKMVARWLQDAQS